MQQLLRDFFTNLADDFGLQVRLIFQPAEEGGAGAAVTLVPFGIHHDGEEW